MKQTLLTKFFLFFCGFVIGTVPIFLGATNYDVSELSNKIKLYSFKQPAREILSSDELYDESMSYELFHQVKVLCWVFTHPANHKDKAVHIKNVWGKRCNKLLFMSTEEDPVIGTIKLPVGSGREQLWNKTVKTYQYVHEHYIDEYDFFMRADDDNFVIMENVRYMLAHYHSKTSLYFGHRFTMSMTENGHNEGYMAGGGYILSKKALSKLVVDILPKNPPYCDIDWGEMDDVYTGSCLDKEAIMVNEMDELKQKRFFPVGIAPHIDEAHGDWWYTNYLWFNTSMGSLRCCSDTFAAMHYVSPQELYELEYFVYHVHPYGLDKNLTESMPRKYSIDEIIAASDQKGFGKEYVNHTPIHNIEKSELFRRK